MPPERRPGEIDIQTLKSLLTVSFNNLVDWHIFVSESQVRIVNNLTEPLLDIIEPLTREDIHRLSVHSFWKSVTSRAKPVLSSCFDAVISVISRWKRALKADFPKADNTEISALFNAIIFLRACEDTFNAPDRPRRALLEKILFREGITLDVCDILDSVSQDLKIDWRQFSSQSASLQAFRKMDRSTLIDLIRDFYRPSHSPYEFHFGLMSKHALSRIYEEYVKLFREESDTDIQQFGLWSTPPSTVKPEKAGIAFTPQFIATFFGRYLRERLTPKAFRTMSLFDPACGSGMFLRTILEMQCDPLMPGVTNETISRAFRGLVGVDRDPNAWEATRLSLSLLHVAFTQTVPAELRVHNANAITQTWGKFDLVVSNPPYIRSDDLTPKDRAAYASYLGRSSSGKTDAYLAFTKLCLDHARPGGFICLVLPQAFLMSENAASLRSEISQECDVLCLADLSSVEVFGGLGVYTILLILRKRDGKGAEFPAQIVRCQDFPGLALGDCLAGRSVETSYYSVFELPQDVFTSSHWTLVEPRHHSIRKEVSSLPHLGTLVDIHQGLITGNDEVFIQPTDIVPATERLVWKPFLPDRQIERYTTPKHTGQRVFHPFLNGGKLSIEQLKQNFSWTWRHLNRHRARLARRRGITEWWRPTRPRQPDKLFRPKIVCPHLMLTPRFALDFDGRYAVSHAPYFATKDGDIGTLKLICAALNSSFMHWYMQNFLFRYGRGYARLEVAQMRSLPMPDFQRVPTNLLSSIIYLVDQRLETSGDTELDRALDELVLDAYGLTAPQKDTIRELWNGN